MRIGIDVGGTNTDAVLMDERSVLSEVKTPTTPDVTSGIVSALRTLISDSGVEAPQIQGVMIGTTHFTNAVVEAKRLMPTACIRLGLPARAALPVREGSLPRTKADAAADRRRSPRRLLARSGRRDLAGRLPPKGTPDPRGLRRPQCGSASM
jgi:N-methylhydantoinase A/oxoprolinase/acetone carboxylase beta subunit